MYYYKQINNFVEVNDQILSSLKRGKRTSFVKSNHFLSNKFEPLKYEPVVKALLVLLNGFNYSKYFIKHTVVCRNCSTNN